MADPGRMGGKRTREAMADPEITSRERRREAREALQYVGDLVQDFGRELSSMGDISGRGILVLMMLLIWKCRV
ncbi:hypothetical protein NL676_006064 [Syzygium grande]|nr:hypothetical protein NL676_006064 [Syzygium grande]